MTKKLNLPDINVKELMGFLPLSVWNLNANKEDKKLANDQGEATTRRSGNTVVLPNLKFSRFNTETAKCVYRYWSERNDLVLDPFSGRSTRAVMAIKENRRYVGYDVSTLACNMMLSNETITESVKIGNCEIINGDGCKLANTLDNSIDLVFTCPPYWNQEKYESVDGQLSDCRTYEDFLSSMRECFDNCHRVLKLDKYCIVVIGDIRRDKAILPLHKDFIELGMLVGFKLHDVVIEQIRTPHAFWRVRENYRCGFTAKAHQYILVFKKKECHERLC